MTSNPLRDPDAAAPHLRALARLPLSPAVQHETAEALRTSTDPDRALPALVRWLEALVAAGEAVPEGVVPVVAPVAGASGVLTRLLVRDPGLGARLAADPFRTRPKGPALLREAALLAEGAPPDTDAFDCSLRQLRNREMLRIASRELAGEDVRETAAELSVLAEACIQAALHFADARLQAAHGVPRTEPCGEPCGFVVMGMGKLGGGELNYSSDVDLIYFYETDDGRTDGARPLSLHEYYARLSEAVTRSLSRVTGEGLCFRVDLGLRPEGIQGPICNSLPAAESYYESWGHPWERVAWVRARPVAGDLALGERLQRLLEPFVWRRALDFGALDDIRRMKEQIDQRAARARAQGGVRGWDLKVGEGGIREIEFFVNAFQLVYGGRMPGLREVSTLRALDRLHFSGLVSEDLHDSLRDAYLLFRRVEHRLQIAEERQTHALPAEPAALDALGRTLGLRGDTPGTELIALLDGPRRAVSAAFGGLLGGGAEVLDPLVTEAGAALDPRLPDAARIEALARLGFIVPAEALSVLQSLERRPTTLFHERHRSRFGALCTALVREAGQSPAPAQALRLLRDFVWNLRESTALYGILQHNPHVRRLLITLFGSSPFLGRAMIRRPYLLESLLFQGDKPRVKQRDAMQAELDAWLARVADLEAALNLCRRYQTEEIARIGLLDLAGGLDYESVGYQLADLADTLASAVLRRAEEELERSRPGEVWPISIVGLGRLGAREMGYSSDLDVLFLYRNPADPAAAPVAHGRAARLAQRFITHVACLLAEGSLYSVDSRLRPSGGHGALVSSEDAFRRYHSPAGQADWWERQALIKWRFVTGAADVERALQPFVRETIFLEEPPADLTARMHRLRARLESEVAQEKGAIYNAKFGRGGIVDIEFVTQRSQLLHGHRHPSATVGHTPLALRRLVAEGLLPEDEGEVLLEAYAFLRRLENRIRIVHDRAVDVLDATSEDAVRLARRMGYGDLPDRPAKDQLMAHYRRHTEAVRAVYARHFGEG